MKKINFILFSILILFSLRSIHGQGDFRPFAEIIDEISAVTSNPESFKKEIFENIKRTLNDPATLNFVLKEITGTGSSASILKDLNIKFNTFEYSDTSSIGLAYDFNKVIKENTLAADANDKTGIAFNLSSSGSIVLTKHPNPFDYTKSNLSFHFYKSIGGAVAITDEQVIKKNELEAELVEYTDIDELNKSKAWKEYLEIVTSNLTDQFYFDFSLNAAIESNQKFTLKNYAYGAKLGIDVKAWNQESTLANLNIFDWPFAVVRWLTGTEDNIYPRGSTIPTLLVKLDYVDPQKDPWRESMSGLKMYPRLGFEAAFKTLAAETGGEPVYFSANLRYFKELDSPAAIKHINMDEQFYFTFALTQQRGLYISYTTGKLPLDQQTNDVYEIGWVWGI
ncbi:MAG: hypothetical protein K9J16_08695 [Melioribacteraceae bacterium]|nr:hypothetical protein [Melioribacteraceae bacterium]MCF8353777.1 hypothetical protein [Melioribacteraceae bacterium]MCF8393613.1 hypothetical protein [Melioribacteraceae bacterium]MCF8419423.1 hypothetical protein [Melioribacteraceae bacterium]